MPSLRSGRSRLLPAVAVALLAPGAALAQSNSCGSATLIAPGTYSGTTVGSTNDGSASCGSSASSPDVWYRIVPAQNGSLSATTCQAASYDTVLSIHNACGGGTELVCNDDSCGLRSSVQTNVTAGTTYYIRVAGFAGATGTFTLEVALGEPGPPPGDGPDVIYSDIGGISHYGPVGGVHAYALGTHTCNIGDVNLHWGGSWSGSPIVGFNAYRLSNGRLEQIGQSFGKKACCAAAGSGCAIACNGVGGSLLGTGCRDIYGSSYNGSHGVLAPRSGVNAFTGAMTTPSSTTGDAIFKRLQVTQADLSTPGALYFVEGVYVGNDDAPAGNALNNASYKRVTVTAGTFAMNEQGVMAVGQPAIMAWRTHGLGVNVEDTSVTLGTADVPDEGRFHYAHKVTDLGNGTFRYDYAVFNLNSDRSGGSFSVPVPGGVTVVSTGFRDVNYHSGEPYANTDWTVSTSGGAVTWSSPQTFAQNPNSNALRWGTMYNFWFVADAGPGTAQATLGLFKPHTPSSVAFDVSAPVIPECPADFNQDGLVSTSDISSFLSVWFADVANGTTDADFDGSGATSTADISAFLSAWFAAVGGGC